VAEVTLSSAQVLAANGTPIEVVPAPGVGRANIPIVAIASVAFVSAAYATNTSLTVGYGGAGILTITGILAATSSKVATAAGTIPAVAIATAQNAAINVSVATGNPITGDSPVTVSVLYVTVNL
jgi:hypothetical protein